MPTTTTTQNQSQIRALFPDGPKQQLYPSGLWVEPLALAPGHVRIEDIAHHLSMQCRHGGAVARFYSTAEHCVRVSLAIGRNPYKALTSLFYKATDYVLWDVQRDVKRAVGREEYRRAEGFARYAISLAFGLIDDSPELSAEIERVSNAISRIEEYHLKRKPDGRLCEGWWPRPDPSIANLTDASDIGWAPEVARQRFMDRFEELRADQQLRGVLEASAAQGEGLGN